ncbi:MAG: endonuclease Q family protein [Proteobacteria bacterium]|nr:endonuclease Q family protein [Pseudomonadota bacterium]MBU1650139.1 endonuclease Q family protein [Pseudomonadota bacterium]
MRFIADLHIHSLYSRATSKSSHIRSLAAWSQIKGVHLLGTGDFTHPLWFRELQETVEPAEPGFFQLKGSLRPDFPLPFSFTPSPEPLPARFVLSAEVSCIYKRHGRVRKVHNLIYVPDFTSAGRINETLATIGNLAADGRPILGLDSRDLLEIVLDKAPGGFLVPAHIWTPWFSLFGSRSGFDSVEECFGDLTSHIFSLETGLSSDPAMNRLISALDHYTLISNSDCHSPGKLCREANVFDTTFDFFAMKAALQNPCDASGHRHLAATIEFFPEEGKYHYDGHRKCGFCCDPYQSRELHGLCPVCGKPMTIGVLSRVLCLADRQSPVFPSGAPDVYSLIPLQEILAELLGVGPGAKTVMRNYLKLIQEFGSELTILTETPVADLLSADVPCLGEAISRVRQNQIQRKAGFDGEFGTIKVYKEGEGRLKAKK